MEILFVNIVLDPSDMPEVKYCTGWYDNFVIIIHQVKIGLVMANK